MLGVVSWALKVTLVLATLGPLAFYVNLQSRTLNARSGLSFTISKYKITDNNNNKDRNEQSLEVNVDWPYVKKMTQLERARLEEFRQLQLDMLNGKRSPVRVSINGYTICGYGNKLYSMVSSTVIALLTNSALVIRWHNISSFIEEPVPLSFASFSHLPESTFNAEYQPHELYKAQHKQRWLRKRNLATLVKSHIPTHRRRILYNKFHPLFFELCSNPTYYEKLRYYQLVSQDTIDTARANLEKPTQRHLNDLKVNSVLQVGFEVAGNLLNRMWIPKRTLRERIDFVAKRFLDHFVIGIQLRNYFLNGDVDRRRFFECAISIENEVLKEMGIGFSEKYKGFKWFDFVYQCFCSLVRFC